MSTVMNDCPQPTSVFVMGYCVHCRTRRQMNGAIQVCNRRGGWDLKGQCNVCGKGMYRLGGWDTVASQTTKETRQATQSQNDLGQSRNTEHEDTNEDTNEDINKDTNKDHALSQYYESVHD